MEMRGLQVEFPNIRHLRVFREVAACHSISQAAERVHLSQPAVTQATGKLETELGVRLFDRRRDGLFATEIGEIVLRRVQRVLAHLRNGARHALRTGGRAGARGFSNFDELLTAAQLRALAALSDTGSFSIAARNLGISQPTIHRSARNLESLSGLTLFTATANGIELTPAAEILARHTKLAYSEMRQALDEIGSFLGRDSTKFMLGSLPLPRTHVVPRAVDAMIRSTTHVQVHVIDGRYEELLRALRQGEMDCIIGALRDPAPADDVVQEPLFKDPLAIVARPGHPLAGKPSVSLQDTLAYPWVAPPKQTPAGSYLFGTLRIHELPATPVRVVSSSLVFLRGLLMQGDYLTIISRHQIQEEERQGLMVALPVTLKDSEREIGLTYRRDWQPTKTQARFIDFLREAGAEVGTARDDIDTPPIEKINTAFAD